MRRAPRSAATALVAALALAGCASVPDSGPVEYGPAAAVGGQDLIYRAIPQPPHVGMTPDEVVGGFLAATSSGSDGYQVARQFLTPSASAGWKPLAVIRVYDSTGLTTTAAGPVRPGATRITVAGVLDGTVGADSAYQAAPAGQRFSVGYDMRQVGGQWRIAALPQGLVVGRGDIDREFRSYPVYFFDPTYQVLVPDYITVSATGSGLATTLVQSLLQGPSTWLAPAVRTAFPEGTALTLGSVPVDDQGVAQVDLTSQVLSANDATRTALSGQLLWTLRRLPGVAAVRLTVSGQPLSIPGAAALQSITAPVGYDADASTRPGAPLLVVGPAGLEQTGAAGRLVPISGALGRGSPAVTSPAVSTLGTVVAAVSADRRELYTQLLDGSAAPQRVLVGGTDLSRPSWGRDGSLWIVDRGGRGVLRIIKGVAGTVPVIGLPAGVTAAAIVLVAISPDGTRAALLLRRAGRVEPWLARVEVDGATLRLAAPVRVESVIVDAVDLSWDDVDSLTVLGQDGASTPQLFDLTPGVPAVAVQAAPAGATAVATGPGRALVVSAAGRILEQSAGSWAVLGAGSAPAYGH